MQFTTSRWRAATPALVFFAVLLAQLPLILNPGYFSPDELQWAVRADDGYVFSWLDNDAFQYRPLTFNLWMWLSWHLFEQPQAFHAVLVAITRPRASDVRADARQRENEKLRIRGA